MPINVTENRNCSNAELFCCPNDSEGNFSSVRNQNLVKEIWTGFCRCNGATRELRNCTAIANHWLCCKIGPNRPNPKYGCFDLGRILIGGVQLDRSIFDFSSALMLMLDEKRKGFLGFLAYAEIWTQWSWKYVLAPTFLLEAALDHRNFTFYHGLNLWGNLFYSHLLENGAPAFHALYPVFGISSIWFLDLSVRFGYP